MENSNYTTADILRFLAEKKFRLIRSVFSRNEVADIAEFFEEDSLLAENVALFRLVAKPKRADLFTHFHHDLQNKMLVSMPNIVVISLLNDMDPVDRTHLLEGLPEELRSKLIAQLDPTERKMAWQLLSYPEDSIGRLMSPEFVAVRPEISVKEALGFIRWNAAGIDENLLHHIFVTDENGKLKGYVSLSVLVMADPASTPVSDVMGEVSYALSAFEEEVAAVDHFRKYDKPYIPVVDEQKHLVGIVQSDDVFDVAEEEATEDILAFGGQAVLEDSYLHTPVWTLLKKRGSWLAMIFLMMMFTANVLEAYESSFTIKYLLIFLPLIISSGGNSGSQAASLIIRGLAVKELDRTDWWKVFKREIVIGLALGLLLGALGYWRVVFVGDLGTKAGLTIGLSLISIVVFGAVAGSMLPLLLKWMRLDPAVSSSPVIASLVDIFGIFTLFNIAIWMTGLSF